MLQQASEIELLLAPNLIKKKKSCSFLSCSFWINAICLSTSFFNSVHMNSYNSLFGMFQKLRLKSTADISS